MFYSSWLRGDAGEGDGTIFVFSKRKQVNKKESPESEGLLRVGLLLFRERILFSEVL